MAMIGFMYSVERLPQRGDRWQWRKVIFKSKYFTAPCRNDGISSSPNPILFPKIRQRISMPISVEKLRKIHPAIWLVVATVASLALFLNKPFSTDDPLFIWTAKHIQAHSLTDFYGFTVNWYGTESPMYEVQQNPPLLAYYLALVGNFFGWSEVALHSAMLLPALLVVLGTWKLAGEYVSRPWLAAVAALLTPAVLVSSTSVMCDVMMLGFWIWAVIFWMQGIKSNQWKKFLMASVLISLSALTKYYGLAVIPLLLVYSFIKTRRVGWWLLYFLVPAAVMAWYQWYTARLYGHGLLSNAATYANESRSHDYYGQLVEGLGFTGGATIVVLFYAPFLWNWRHGLILLGLGLVVAVPILFRDQVADVPMEALGNFKTAALWQLAFLAVAGTHLLALAIVQFRVRLNADTLLLVSWIFGALIFSVFVNWTINVRSLLPIAPAIAILLVARLEQRGGRLKKMLLPLIPGGLMALSLAWADYDYAALCKKAARMFCQDYSGSRLWFQGHWGFQYYMQEFGAQEIDFNRSKLFKGDVIISPEHNTNLQNLNSVAPTTNMVEFWPRAFFAVSSPKHGAGFYSSIGGPVPFTLGPGETEQFTIRNMNKDLSYAAGSCVNHILRGNQLWEKNNRPAAMIEYRQALRFTNDVPANGLAMIAWIMATTPDKSLRDGPEALRLALRANELTSPPNPRFIDVLGAAYAENGRMEEAIQTANSAATLADAQGLKDLATFMRERVRLYQNGQPFRDQETVPVRK